MQKLYMYTTSYGDGTSSAEFSLTEQPTGVNNPDGLSYSNRQLEATIELKAGLEAAESNDSQVRVYGLPAGSLTANEFRRCGFEWPELGRVIA